MSKSIIDKVSFWGMDMLSLLGAKPYTTLSRKLLLVLLFVALLPPLIWLIFLVTAPIYLSFRYPVRGRKWPWYVLSAIPVVVWLTSTRFVMLFELVGILSFMFVIITTTGILFNKFLVPKLIKAIIDLQAYEDSAEGAGKFEDSIGR